MTEKTICVKCDDSLLASAVDWLKECAAETGINVNNSEGYCVHLEIDNTPFEQDWFKVGFNDDSACITGNRPRAVIYGIDDFLRRFAGARFFDGKAHMGPPQNPLVETRAQALFAQRGVWDKSIDDEWVKALVHNRYNQIGVSRLTKLLARDESCMATLRRAEKYDLDVIVGGHIVSEMIDIKELFKNDPEACALIGSSRVASGHLCYSNPRARRMLAEKVLECARKMKKLSSTINRFSVWSEDSAMTCECPSCSEMSFNDVFAGAVDEAAALVIEDGLDIRIEYIIYNGVLGKERIDAFETLKPPANMTARVDCLAAYWGRDYFQPLESSANDFDAIGRGYLEAAANDAQNAGCSLRLYEYYIDNWQLGELFPFLGPVIYEDMYYYHELGVTGFLMDTAGCPTRMENFPLKRLKLLNAAFAGRAMWDDAGKYKDFLDEYCVAMFGPHKDDGREILLVLYTKLAPLSWLNLRHPLPGLVGGNLWYLDMPHETFAFDPDNPEQTAVAIRQQELYANAITALEKIKHDRDDVAFDGDSYEFLCGYVNYCLARLRALMGQLDGQQMLRDRNADWKVPVEEGLARDAELGWPSREYFEEWLKSDLAAKILESL